MSKRLFIGIPISGKIKEKIKPLYAKLKETGAELNFVSWDNLHLTLKFLGNVQEDQIEEIKKRLAAIKPEKFILKFKGVGAFPDNEQIKVIWIGVESPELIQLMKEINLSLNYIRENEQEENAHLTLARVKSAKNKEKLPTFLRDVKGKKFTEMMADKFILYESELTPKGPKYKKLQGGVYEMH